MPNRFLKDSITCSRSIDSLTWFQEVLYYRLIVVADDFGRFYADPGIIKGKLFPLKEERLKRDDVASGLKALEAAGMIKIYEWDGNTFLEITHWSSHQQVRAKKSKFPDNNGSYVRSSDNGCKQSLSDDNKCKQSLSDDNNGKQKISDDNNCFMRQSAPNTNTNTNTNTYIEDEDAISIQKDHNEILNAADEIGLPATQQNINDLLNLYAEQGKEAVLYAITQAGKYNKVSIAYIESVTKNHSKPKDDEEQIKLLV